MILGSVELLHNHLFYLLPISLRFCGIVRVTEERDSQCAIMVWTQSPTPPPPGTMNQQYTVQSLAEVAGSMCLPELQLDVQLERARMNSFRQNTFHGVQHNNRAE